MKLLAGKANIFTRLSARFLPGFTVNGVRSLPEFTVIAARIHGSSLPGFTVTPAQIHVAGDVIRFRDVHISGR